MSEFKTISPAEIVEAYRATGKKPISGKFFNSTKFNFEDLDYKEADVCMVEKVDCCCPLGVLSVHLGMDPAKVVQKHYKDFADWLKEHPGADFYEEELGSAAYDALGFLLDQDGGALEYLIGLGYNSEYLNGFVAGVDNALNQGFYKESEQRLLGRDHGKLAWAEVVKEIGVADEATQAS